MDEEPKEPTITIGPMPDWEGDLLDQSVRAAFALSERASWGLFWSGVSVLAWLLVAPAFLGVIALGVALYALGFRAPAWARGAADALPDAGKTALVLTTFSLAVYFLAALALGWTGKTAIKKLRAPWTKQ